MPAGAQVKSLQVTRLLSFSHLYISELGSCPTKLPPPGPPAQSSAWITATASSLIVLFHSALNPAARVSISNGHRTTPHFRSEASNAGSHFIKSENEKSSPGPT